MVIKTLFAYTITTVVLFSILFLSTISLTHAQTPTINDGDLIQATGSSDVFIVKLVDGKRFKRLILNPAIFESYGHLRWENIKQVPSYVVDSYRTSNLVREIYPNGRLVTGTVYALFDQGDSGTKRLVQGGSYDSDSVYNINHLEASNTFYRTGSPIILGTNTDDAGIVSSLSAPNNLRVVSTTTTTIHLSWEGVSGATKYKIEWRNTGTNNNYWHFTTTHKVAVIWGHLTPNRGYDIRVQGLNRYDIGGAYAYASAITSSFTPSPQVQIPVSTQTPTQTLLPDINDASQTPSYEDDSGIGDPNNPLTSNEIPPDSGTGTTNSNSGSSTSTTQDEEFRIKEQRRSDGSLEYKYYYRITDDVIAKVEYFRENGILIYRAYYNEETKLEQADFYRANGTLMNRTYYNEDEQIERIDRYRENGILYEREEYSYKGDGKRLDNREYYDDDGMLDRLEIYSDDGTLKEKNYYRSDGTTLLYKTEYTGTQFVNHTYRADGTKERSKAYDWESGKLISITEYYKNGSISKIEYFRSDDGTLSRVETFTSSGNPKQAKEYDKNGDVTSITNYSNSIR